MCTVFTILQFTILITITSEDASFTIIHTGDVHANFEQDSKDIGGVGRIVSYVKKQRESDNATIYLDTGDMFTGSIWFSVHRTKITADFVKLMDVDAIALGNHEFDEGIDELGKYLKDTDLPIVCANADFSRELGLRGYLKPSVVLTVGEVKVGVIGYINRNLEELAPIGEIVVEDEQSAIRREIRSLKAQGVNIIIGLGHSGYAADQALAAHIDDLDIIVGGHTHTLLYNTDSPLPRVTPEGNYPTIVKNPIGREVPIVHAYAFAKIIGKLKVTFDDRGFLKSYSGEPVLLDASIESDPEAIDLLNKYRPAIEALKQQVLGQSRVHLTGKCRVKECNLANLLLDAFIHFKCEEYEGPYWSNVAVALINGGAIRRSISPDPIDGNITAADIYGAIPFDNILVTIEVNGSTLLNALEYGVSSDGNTSRGEFLQFAGVHVSFNLKREPWTRVENVKIRCSDCTVPVYEPLDVAKVYRIVVNHYLATGGDGYGMLRDGALRVESEPVVDADTLKDYIRFYQTIQPQLEERIIIKNLKKTLFIYSSGKKCCCNFVIVVTVVTFGYNAFIKINR